MTLPLTPDTLKAAYDYLATTPPFSKWNMPDSDDVKFVVARSPTHHGWWDKKRWAKKHLIAISRAKVGHTTTLLATVAHEMLHVHQREAGMETRGEHNAAFRRLAARVCRFHGFDEKVF